MRKSRNGQRRAFAAFTKFSVLLMCFATVLALVLTAGVFDIGGSDMNANVAEASTSGGSTTALDTSMRFDMEDFHTEYNLFDATTDPLNPYNTRQCQNIILPKEHWFYH